MSETFSLDLLLGLSAWIVLSCGRVSLATAAFYTVGAASTAAMLRHGWHDPEAAAAGIAGAAAAGYVVGLLLARVDTTRFTIATFIVGMAIPSAVSLKRLPAAHWIGADTSLIVTALAVVLLAIFLRSRDGSAFAAVGQDERAAASVGMNPPAIRCLSLTISGAIAGLAGALNLFLPVALVSAQSALAVNVSSVAIAVVGGVSSIAGPLLGAAALSVAQRAGLQFPQGTIVCVAAALLVAAIVLPGGFVSLARPLLFRGGAR